MNTTLKNNLRSRNWHFLLFTDNLPYNYFDILKAENAQVILSPLHNMDINFYGELVKPHIHVIIHYESVKSYSQICQLTDKLNAVYPRICHNVKDMVRYFIHTNHPKKYQYKKSDILTIGNVDLGGYFYECRK